MCVDISQHAGHHSITMIDTLAIYEMLNAAGFKPQQAQAITKAIAASKGATSELKAKRDIEQRGASTALAVEQCSVRLHKSIRRPSPFRTASRTAPVKAASMLAPAPAGCLYRGEHGATRPTSWGEPPALLF